MPITRTAMIDDDGSKTTGTIVNNAWKTELYNQIDGAVAGASNPLVLGVAYYSEVPSTTFNDWDLGSVGNYTVFKFGTAAGAMGITGIVAKPSGTVYVIINTGPHSISLVSLNAASSPANQLVGPGFATLVLTAYQSVRLLYDGAWIMIP